MKYKDLKTIHEELTNIIFGFYRDEQEAFNKMNLFEQYKTINETMSFLFEDYQKEFDQIKINSTDRILCEEQLQIERSVFISWATVCVLKRLRNYTDQLKTTMDKPVGNK